MWDFTLVCKSNQKSASDFHLTKNFGSSLAAGNVNHNCNSNPSCNCRSSNPPQKKNCPLAGDCLIQDVVH